MSIPSPYYSLNFLLAGINFYPSTGLLTWPDGTSAFVLSTNILNSSYPTSDHDVGHDPATGLRTGPEWGVKIPPFSLGSTFSFELRFKFTDLADSQSILGIGDHNNNDSFIQIYRLHETQRLAFRIVNGADLDYDGITRPEGTLYVYTDIDHDGLSHTTSELVHLVITHDDNSTRNNPDTGATQFGTKIYINGIEEAVTPYFYDSFYSGLKNETRTQFTIGSISQHDTGSDITQLFSLYNSVLSQEDVTKLYQIYRDNEPDPDPVATDTVTATGAPLQIIPNVNLNKLN